MALQAGQHRREVEVEVGRRMRSARHYGRGGRSPAGTPSLRAVLQGGGGRGVDELCRPEVLPCGRRRRDVEVEVGRRTSSEAHCRQGRASPVEAASLWVSP